MPGRRETLRSVLVIVRLQLLRGVLVVVRSMFARMLVVVHMIGVGVFMFVLVNMPVLMAMHMGVRMTMSCAIGVRMFVGMGVGVFVLVAMLVLVFPFHVITSRSRLLVRRRAVRRRGLLSTVSLPLFLVYFQRSGEQSKAGSPCHSTPALSGPHSKLRMTKLAGLLLWEQGDRGGRLQTQPRGLFRSSLLWHICTHGK